MGLVVVKANVLTALTESGFSSQHSWWLLAASNSKPRDPTPLLAQALHYYA